MYRVSLEMCLDVTANNIAMLWTTFGNINLHCVSGQIMVLIEIPYLHDPIFFMFMYVQTTSFVFWEMLF